jgi:hypothetical protein
LAAEIAALLGVVGVFVDGAHDQKMGIGDFGDDECGCAQQGLHVFDGNHSAEKSNIATFGIGGAKFFTRLARGVKAGEIDAVRDDGDAICGSSEFDLVIGVFLKQRDDPGGAVVSDATEFDKFFDPQFPNGADALAVDR